MNKQQRHTRKTHKIPHKKPNTPNKPNKTKKTIQHNGKIIDKKEGWIVLQVYGDAYQRGFAHGYLLHNELKRTMHVFNFFLKNELKISHQKYLKIVKTKIEPKIRTNYPEFYEEMRGISKGAKAAGEIISVEFILAWNSYITIYSFLKDGAAHDPKHTPHPNHRQQRCSAFIATGDVTATGEIVMAHTTHTNFADGQLANIVLYVYPTSGFSFVMQTQPGLIASGTDWFLCSSGIIGCETTIGDISYKPIIDDPFFCRIRQCMQYGASLDDYENIMTTRNGGDYACSWLLGDTHTQEIMLFELGLSNQHTKRKTNGVFYGMNSAIGKSLREKDTSDHDLENISTSSGNRNARFKELFSNEYKKNITVEDAKKIISDHYDKTLNIQDKNSLGICKHNEFDHIHSKEPNFMYGSTDAKVVNSQMAKDLTFVGRFGSGCGRTFDIEKHLKGNPQYEKWRTVVDDFPYYEWRSIHP